MAKTSSQAITDKDWDGKYISPEPIQAPWQTVLYVPKYAPWGPLINQLAIRLVDAGIVDHICSRYSVIRPKKGDTFEAIRLDQLLAAFILLVGGLILAILVFSLEAFSALLKSRKGQHTRR